MQHQWMLLTITFIGATAQAFAHGAPEYPISRQYNCYKNPQLPACQAAIAGGREQALYDWNGVNQLGAAGNHQAVVPDGTLCAGGKQLFQGFDLARGDWPATSWAPSSDGRTNSNITRLRGTPRSTSGFI